MLEILSNTNVIFYLLAYFIGAIPFGLLICKVFYHINLREIGSGSIGATNVYRAIKEVDPTNAKKYSILTILLDSFKGLFVVALAKFYGLSYETQWSIAVLSILGHCYSPYLNFTGGKGVATAIGSIFLLIPIEGLLGLIVWFVVGKIFKISSLSSLLGVLSGIVFSFIVPYCFDLPQNIDILKQIGSHSPVIIIGILILYTHIPNIIRLIKKEEKQIF
ncbi:glycerol-3-phosphate acyltransferase [Helicobacter enhydrae]|uniref:Glycerol-3-phosphate acyltransferase n=1 Tax=Helicobacter enhydrae TaxID=222136 RepID=A0A1B1U5Z4_9HELI|nr:glycerol-3-phosphate 1-O-acyltransferase PlsY [Helicobacter enhydrae]ANV98179.1 glycerol-3-phosphate acyltransferase [Helicobacter enhydrae]